MLKRLIVLYFVIILSIIKAEAQELPLTHFTTASESNPLPSAMVTNVYQDREGFIWMSVFSSGLIRYDGANMVLYAQQDGLPDLGIWQVLEDKQGYLWASSNAGILVSEEPISSYKSGRRVRFTTQFGGIPLFDEALTINHLAADSHGKIWVATVADGMIGYFINESGLLEVDTVATNLNSSINLSVTAVFPKKTEGLIFGLEGGILAEMKNGQIDIVYSPRSGSNEQNFVSIFEDDLGQVWTFKQNGELLRFAGNRLEPELVSKEAQTNITGIFVMEEGNIWTSNAASGIKRFDEKSITNLGGFTRANGLLSDNIFHVYKDREDNIWIAQSGGVSKLRFNYQAFENFTAESNAGEKPVLPSAKVNTVLVPGTIDSPCKVWVGTEGGLSCIHQDGQSTVFDESDGLLGDWVNGIEQDQDGRIWVATTQGLNAIVFDQKLIIKGAENIKKITIRGKNAYLFNIPESPPIIASEKLTIPGSGAFRSVESIWFPGLRSLTFVLGQEVLELDENSGLPAQLFKSVAIDQEGHLFVGTLDKGLYKSEVPLTVEKLQDPRFRSSKIFMPFWNTENGAPTNHIEKLLWHEGKIWVGTQQGLIALDPNAPKILNLINKESGLPANNTISFAVSPSSGNFWIGSNQGLTEFDPSTNAVIRTVTRLDGLIDNEVWLYGSLKIDHKGQVYYGTSNGLSIYHPDFDRINNVPPIVQFTLIETSMGSEDRNEITFEYAAMSFANVSGVRYRTRLLGYDDNWSEPSTVRRLRYTNLPAFFWSKKYTLEVMAINESGVESLEPIRYSFNIEPVWWLQWWSFIIYLVILGLILYVFDKYQRAKLIKKERDAARLREAELHAQTATARSMAAEAESKALQTEIEKKAIELEKVQVLEKAYNELKSAQNQLIQAEKMASLGRLATGIAHEIKNPLNFINNFASVTVELIDELSVAIKDNDLEEIDYLMASLKENTSKIEKHGLRADAIVQSMAQHAKVSKSAFDFVDLNGLIEHYQEVAVKSKKSKTPDLKIIVELDLQKDLGKVKVFAQELGQALLNIIGNALDAVWSEKKAKGEAYEPKVIITSRVIEDFIEIKIADNGPGIQEEIRERIFEPFFTTKPTGEGTGLGLSLSYDIITQSHSGTLTVETEIGKGTAFFIHIPRN
ncbi:sensor histidine kinase [Fontibacter flavus]|uniref:histidine kinase n=1 Tax=Fontibacter flavus TaxID=654838 RepID=A0ABV6FT04_9BACT